MATITYQCNRCKRQISKLENQQGLTVYGKCIITEGCLGQLNTIGRNIDSIRETFPSEVIGLLDYSPRKALFTFKQNIPSKSWAIRHDLSTSPAVVVFVANTSGKLTQLDPENFTIAIVDPNNIILNFTQPLTGEAQCVARSTSVTTSTPTTSSMFQVTNGGVLTMAVQQLIVNSNSQVPNVDMTTATFTVQLTVTQPSQQPVQSVETISVPLNTASPWENWPKILVRKRKNYLTRTKNIYDFSAFGGGGSLNTTNIANGTRVQFSRIQFPFSQYRPIDSREMLVLLSNSPYAAIDKIRNKVIDLGEMLDSNINYFVYNNGELFVDASNIEVSYPDTIQVL